MHLYILCFVTLHTACSSVHSARILGLFPHPGKSHQMVFDPLLRKLAERGHEVTVATFFPLESRPTNYTEINLQSLAELRLESFSAEIYENPSWLMKVPVIGNVVDQYILHENLGKLALSVCEKLTKFPPLNNALMKYYDAVIVERFDSACVHGLLDVYGIKAPVIGISSCALMPGDAAIMGASTNPTYVPVVTSSFKHQMSFLERLENVISEVIIKQIYHEVRIKEQAIIESHYGKRISNLDDELNKITLLLVNSYFVSNGVYPLVPGIVEVGGIHIDAANKKIPAHIEKFVNESEHGIILFSFGSQLSSTSISKQKQDIFIRSFSKLNERILWKYADSADEGTLVANNILQVKWLPQNELLKHPKVKAFIGHGGMLGSLEAISAGKPMIVIPIFADQKLNAAAMNAIGVAEILSLSNLNKKYLDIALENVLSERMRKKAGRVSEMWHDRESKPLDTAVYWTERVIRWGNQSPLYSQAKHLSFYQYTLLDVAAFIAVCTISIIGISSYILIHLFKLLRNNICNVTTKHKMH